MIYVFCHIGAKTPNGGVKILFEYAQALINSGFNAAILIPGAHLYPNDCPNGYKPSWFETSVPVYDDVRIVKSDDIVIIHEEGIWCFNHLAVNNPYFIMINQGLQSSITDNVGLNITYDFAKKVYKKCIGVIAISPYIADGINKLFDVKKSNIHIIENPVDDFFKPGKKQNTILVMNKQPNNVVAKMILKIVNERYSDWEIKYIFNMSLKQVAEEMSRAKIFIFLCTPHGEGSSLPPIEAALSGCSVIGYSGLGSRYYYKLPIFTEIEYNDVVGFIEVLDQQTALYKNSNIIFQKEIEELRQIRSKQYFTSRVNYVFKELIGG